MCKRDFNLTSLEKVTRNIIETNDIYNVLIGGKKLTDANLRNLTVGFKMYVLSV